MDLLQLYNRKDTVTFIYKALRYFIKNINMYDPNDQTHTMVQWDFILNIVKH